MLKYEQIELNEDYLLKMLEATWTDFPEVCDRAAPILYHFLKAKLGQLYCIKCVEGNYLGAYHCWVSADDEILDDDPPVRGIVGRGYEFCREIYLELDETLKSLAEASSTWEEYVDRCSNWIPQWRVKRNLMSLYKKPNETNEFT